MDPNNSNARPFRCPCRRPSNASSMNQSHVDSAPGPSRSPSVQPNEQMTSNPSVANRSSCHVECVKQRQVQDQPQQQRRSSNNSKLSEQRMSNTNPSYVDQPQQQRRLSNNSKLSEQRLSNTNPSYVDQPQEQRRLSNNSKPSEQRMCNTNPSYVDQPQPQRRSSSNLKSSEQRMSNQNPPYVGRPLKLSRTITCEGQCGCSTCPPKRSEEEYYSLSSASEEELTCVNRSHYRSCDPSIFNYEAAAPTFNNTTISEARNYVIRQLLQDAMRLMDEEDNETMEQLHMRGEIEACDEMSCPYDSSVKITVAPNQRNTSLSCPRGEIEACDEMSCPYESSVKITVTPNQRNTSISCLTNASEGCCDRDVYAHGSEGEEGVLALAVDPAPTACATFSIPTTSLPCSVFITPNPQFPQYPKFCIMPLPPQQFSCERDFFDRFYEEEATDGLYPRQVQNAEDGEMTIEQEYTQDDMKNMEGQQCKRMTNDDPMLMDGTSTNEPHGVSGGSFYTGTDDVYEYECTGDLEECAEEKALSRAVRKRKQDDDCDDECNCCHCRAVRALGRPNCMAIAAPQQAIGPDNNEMKFFIDSIIMDLDSMAMARRVKENPNQSKNMLQAPSICPRRSFPVSIIEVSELATNSLYVKWEIHDCIGIGGYEIYVDNELNSRYHSGLHTSAVLFEVDVNVIHKINLVAVPSSKRGGADCCCGGDTTSTPNHLDKEAPREGFSRTKQPWVPSIYLYDPGANANYTPKKPSKCDCKK